jgi:site-specific DNA-methyltransferase (adenine-specific)
MIQFYCADIHEKIKDISDNSIDFIYTSPPYGITTNKWDKPLDWELLFNEMWRVLKPTGIIVLYASCPFTYKLLTYEKPKYHYSWKKNNSTGFFKAKQQPLRVMEEIFVYYKKQGTYNPKMEGNTKYPYIYKPRKSSDYYGKGSQNETDKNILDYDKSHIGKYPTTYKEWSIRRSKPKSGISRCDEQIDYFINTYSNEGDTILDLTCCNNMVGDRCYKLKRNYIGVDIEYREGSYEEYNEMYK